MSSPEEDPPDDSSDVNMDSPDTPRDAMYIFNHAQMHFGDESDDNIDSIMTDDSDLDSDVIEAMSRATILDPATRNDDSNVAPDDWTTSLHEVLDDMIANPEAMIPLSSTHPLTAMHRTISPSVPRPGLDVSCNPSHNLPETRNSPRNYFLKPPGKYPSAESSPGSIDDEFPDLKRLAQVEINKARNAAAAIESAYHWERIEVHHLPMGHLRVENPRDPVLLAERRGRSVPSFTMPAPRRSRFYV